ncbi:MAG: LysR family transcriptional regulator [Myxococcota bacterium]
MLDDRRYFVALAKAGSFSRTAQILNVSRSTVMRRLDALEAKLGITLIHRVGRRLALTESGRRYAESLKPVFEALDRVEQELHEADGRLVGRLRLALPFLGSSRFLTPVLAAFRRTHPGVTLDIELARDVRNLEMGSFDVAMQFGTRANPDLRAQLLYREQIILCAASSYVDARGAPTSPEALLAHQVILLRDLEGRVIPWRQTDGRRVELPAPAAVSNSLMVSFELMLEGVGIARVPRLLASEMLHAGTAVHVLPNVTSEAPLLFVYPPEPNPIARAFLTFMGQQSELITEIAKRLQEKSG